MHSDTFKQKFIELRADGLSLGKISDQLGIPKSTLDRWDDRFFPEIQRLRARNWHAFESKYSHRLEDHLGILARRLRQFDRYLDSITPDALELRQVVQVIRETRRDYYRLRKILVAPIESPRLNKEPSAPITEEGDLVDPDPPVNPAPLAPAPEPLAPTPSAKRDKTGRNSENGTTQPLNTNDLQQSPPAPSHFSDSTNPPIADPPAIDPPTTYPLTADSLITESLPYRLPAMMGEPGDPRGGRLRVETSATVE